MKTKIGSIGDYECNFEPHPATDASSAEAEIYLALASNTAPLGASAVVTATGVPRSSVYPTLSALADKGLLTAEAGFGGRFCAVPADQALQSLIARERNTLAQRERLAGNLARQLQSKTSPSESSVEGEMIQVLRDPRVVGERFERLQIDAEREIDIFIKAPFLDPGHSNPTEEKALRRGVKYRALYEQAVINAPEVKPHLSKWIKAGEDARVHAGTLPHKLAIFDRQSILLPLMNPGGQGKTLFIRHPQLALSLGMLFDSLWERAQPISLSNQNGAASAVPESNNRSRRSGGKERKR